MNNLNCFGRETTFITTKGIKSFKDFSDGDKVTILQPDSSWYPAVVRNYGFQPTIKFLLKRARITSEILASQSNEWIGLEGEILTPKARDKLRDPPFFWEGFNLDKLSDIGKRYWCYGFVYGRGVLEKGGKTSKITFRHQHHMKNFSKAGFEEECEFDIQDIYGFPYDKTFPDFSNLSLECLISFIHGYYEARPYRASKRNLTPQEMFYCAKAQTPETYKFIENYFPVAGLYLKSIMHNKLYPADRYYTFFGQYSKKYHWYIEDIEPIEEEVEMWSLGTSFVTEKGIVLE